MGGWELPKARISSVREIFDDGDYEQPLGATFYGYDPIYVVPYDDPHFTEEMREVLSESEFSYRMVRFCATNDNRLISVELMK